MAGYTAGSLYGALEELRAVLGSLTDADEQTVNAITRVVRELEDVMTGYFDLALDR